MPYDVLVKKFNSLPEQSFEEVSDFFDYIIYKFGVGKGGELNEAEQIAKINAACDKMSKDEWMPSCDVSLEAMREATKNDSW